MLEKIYKCPICEQDRFSDHLICTDHFLTKQIFTITKCNACSFLFTNPRPLENNLANYYKSDEYISHSDKAKNLTDKIYKLARHFTMSKKLKIVNSMTTTKSILDFGCGTGDFLITCKNNGWKISGLEPEDSARKIAVDKTQESIYSSIDQLSSISKVNIITLWHVLEHIPNLNLSLSILKEKLDTNGKLLIAVPNHKSFDAKLYKEYWAAYDVPRHLYHFSFETMKLLLKKHGLKIINVLPMKLDSFYVSLLSEKYKTGNTNYIRSFVNGYKSNIYAKKNKNNYSSVIYIAG